MREMQRTIDDLQRRLKIHGAGDGAESGDLERVELEVKLKNAELRIEAL